MNAKNVMRLVDEALAIEAQEAKDVGALGYMARVMVQATIPHKKVEGHVFERRNGAFSLALIAHPRVGLPYGSYPRLLLAWADNRGRADQRARHRPRTDPERVHGPAGPDSHRRPLGYHSLPPGSNEAALHLFHFLHL